MGNFYRLFCLLPFTLIVGGAVEKQPSIDQVLSSCGEYNHHVLTLTGRYFVNSHGSTLSCIQCGGQPGKQLFAVVDWSKHQESSSEPKFDPIIKSRDLQGRPALIEGIVTAEVEVRCSAHFHLYQDAAGETYGTGKGFKGLGSATFYIRRIVAAESLENRGKPLCGRLDDRCVQTRAWRTASARSRPNAL